MGSSSAAVELAYLRVLAKPDRVRIEWGTGQEYNVQFFRILCKREDEPETSYRPIGNPVPAKGGLEEGAEYAFVAKGLARDVSYCFAVEEVTTDGEPGDLFPICGYGPGVTPTSTATPTPTETPTPTPTLTALSPLVTPTPSPTEATTPTNTPTPSPIPLPTLYIVTTYTPTPEPTAALETPTPLPTATPTPQPGLFGLGSGLAGMEFVIGLLCLSGLGIGGLGLLALLVSVFYVRSNR